MRGRIRKSKNWNCGIPNLRFEEFEDSDQTITIPKLQQKGHDFEERFRIKGARSATGFSTSGDQQKSSIHKEAPQRRWSETRTSQHAQSSTISPERNTRVLLKFQSGQAAGMCMTHKST
jgi:hypothetical protein